MLKNIFQSGKLGATNIPRINSTQVMTSNIQNVLQIAFVEKLGS